MRIAPVKIFNTDLLARYYEEDKKKERIQLMQSGARELGIWIRDLFTEGLVAFKQSNKFGLDSMAVRMVDTKNGSLGRRLRILSQELDKESWSEPEILVKLLDLYTLANALVKSESLPLLLKAETLGLCGMNWRKKDLEWVIPVNDQWWCLHSGLEWRENLNVQSAWMVGRKSGFFALINLYAFRFEPFSHKISIGEIWEGDLIFYPSPTPLSAFPSEVFLQIPLSKAAILKNGSFQLPLHIPNLRKTNPLRNEWPVYTSSQNLRTDALQLHDSFTSSEKQKLEKYLRVGKLDPELHFFGVWSMSGFRPLSLITRDDIMDFSDWIK